MIASFVLMDAAPIGGPIGVIAGVVFFLMFLAIAFIAFRLLKKKGGIATRVAVVVLILAIAVLMFGTGTPRPRPHPTPTRPR